MTLSGNIKRLRRQLRTQRYHKGIYRCKKCGGTLLNSNHLDVCNACYEGTGNNCLICGKSVTHPPNIFCEKCKIVNGGMFMRKVCVAKKVRMVNLNGGNKGNVRVVKLVRAS